MIQQEQPELKAASGGRARIPYDGWCDSQQLPIYGGHSIFDPMALELAPWPLFGMDTAFVQLQGMPTVCEGKVSELPVGGSSAQLKQSVGEIVYVLDGQGTTTLWAGDGPKKSIEWKRSSLFILPRNVWFQLANTGSSRARILTYSFRPLAMTSLPDPHLHFNGALEEPQLLYGGGGEFYAAPSMVATESERGKRATAQSNFFPDISAVDQLTPDSGRGGGSRVIDIEFPGAQMTGHVSTVAPLSYKKAYKHGPGRLVLLLRGEGMGAIYTPVGWEQGAFYLQDMRAGVNTKEDADIRVLARLQPNSFFSMPDNWYHQHFNTGSEEARFLVLHPLPQFAGNPYRNQLEYTEEDPWIRKAFEDELAGKGLKSLMPPQAYQDAAWEWN